MKATPWPESILILVNINRLGSVTSTHGHSRRRLLIKSHQRQKYRINKRRSQTHFRQTIPSVKIVVH